MNPINHTARDPNGRSSPIGSTLTKEGANFSLFTKHGLSVELLFFETVEDTKPKVVIKLDPMKNRTYHYWHIFVPGIKAGQLYGYRVYGPFDPAHGHRFDSEKVLLDPYGKAVAVPQKFDRRASSIHGSTDTAFLKSVVADLTRYDWEGDQRLRNPYAKTIIYEMHVGGFTRHPNSGIEPDKRGTFTGLVEKIPYLVDLGITAVELMPVFQFDTQDSPDGLVNYWGYSPISFFAPHQGYSTSNNPLAVLDEFRDMVKELHRAGIEVILDVVFNHTAEGDHHGPCYSFKGIDNAIYYMLEKDKAHYANYSGTGNTLNANQPIVRRMIIDSLHFWVKQMHVDGFRFDLASILSRNEEGQPVENPPVLWDIESDPVLAGTKLIAEAWDAAGLYQVGSFIGDSWKEWNGKFRDDLRSFLRGDNKTISPMASRLFGSPDMYGNKEREPEQSINFVTCHDGFTLNDLVSYNNKNNEANREDNRDGGNDNRSWNCGVEGPTDNPDIEALRNRQVKNFVTLTILALGTPMLSMGDEVRRTQRGNNNAYCQDNEISWFDWSLVKKYADLRRFVKLVNGFRLNRDASRQEFSMTLNELLKKPLITWHGVKLNQPDWGDDSHSLAVTVQSLSGRVFMHYMINAFEKPLEFELPEVSNGAPRPWRRWIDTARPSPLDICLWEETHEVSTSHYQVDPHSVVILIKLMH